MKQNAGYWLSTLQVETQPLLPAQPKQYDERVVGSTYNGRQVVVAKLEHGETIRLRREPNNPYDPNAIRVERLDGEQIGYINRFIAEKLSPQVDAIGGVIFGRVSAIGVTKPPYLALGVRVTFDIPEGGEAHEQLEADF